MTEAAYHAIQVKALRTGRRYLRTQQTVTEKVERQIDRMISSKRVIKVATYRDLTEKFSAAKTAFNNTEKALVDAIAAGNT